MMSVSKVAICEICRKDDGIYSCPRCGRTYCSSICYKSKEHELCSESFYKEWVESSLHEKTFNETDKDKMINILKKFHSDDTQETEDELSIVDRFAGLNLDNVSEDVLWQNLTETEQAEFTDLIKDEKNLETIVDLIQPWWTVTTVERVTEVDDAEENTKISVRPPHPIQVKPLSSVTKKRPSECLRYNLVNIFYAYGFLYRFYNCELRDFLEDVVNGLFQFSPVLSEDRNYFSLEESIQDSIRLIISSDLNIPLDFAKSIANDVSSILQGPENAPPTYFVLCALHDIELMLFDFKHQLKATENVDKSLKKKLMPAIKKIGYYMSWCLDFSYVLSELASDLVILMVPDLIIEPPSIEPTDNLSESKKTPIIEEID